MIKGLGGLGFGVGDGRMEGEVIGGHTYRIDNQI
jgi:hypothetical protein